MKYKFIICFVLFNTLIINAQRAIIPFHINEFNRIILHYFIKNYMLNLCFDSAIPFNILDGDIAKKIDFAKSNNSRIDSITTVANINIGVVSYSGGRSTKLDSVFWGVWLNSDMKDTAKKLELGTNVDGIVGYSSDYTLEFDFLKKMLIVWDTLPWNYLKEDNFTKVKLIDSDCGGTYLHRIGVNPISVRSKLVVLDTLNLPVNLLIDTGSPMYLDLEIFEKSLLDKLVEFKKAKGELYKTVNLKIPDLEIDTLFNKIRVFPHFNPNEINPYRSAIGGLLGVPFLCQYNRVLLNRKTQDAWFER